MVMPVMKMKTTKTAMTMIKAVCKRCYLFETMMMMMIDDGGNGDGNDGVCESCVGDRS